MFAWLGPEAGAEIPGRAVDKARPFTQGPILNCDLVRAIDGRVFLCDCQGTRRRRRGRPETADRPTLGDEPDASILYSFDGEPLEHRSGPGAAAITCNLHPSSDLEDSFNFNRGAQR